MFRTVWKQHPWATAILSLASLAALIFAVRLAVFTIYWMDPAHREVAVEGWMTPGYVAMSWQIPKPVVIEMLGLDERLSLIHISEPTRRACRSRMPSSA